MKDRYTGSLKEKLDGEHSGSSADAMERLNKKYSNEKQVTDQLYNMIRDHQQQTFLPPMIRRPDVEGHDPSFWEDNKEYLVNLIENDPMIRRSLPQEEDDEEDEPEPLQECSICWKQATRFVDKLPMCEKCATESIYSFDK